MADPLSISGTLVGGISLAIELCHNAVDFYNSFIDAPRDIVRMREELKSLADTLGDLQRSIESRHLVPDAKIAAERHARDALESIAKLREKLKEIWTDDPAAFGQLSKENKEPKTDINKRNYTLKRIKERTKKLVGRSKLHTKRTIDRTKYPFREKSIRQLQDIIDRAKASLILAMQIFSNFASDRILDSMDDLEDGFAQIRQESIAYQQQAKHMADQLSNNLDKLQSGVKSHDVQTMHGITEVHEELDGLGERVEVVKNEIRCTEKRLLGEVRDLQERAESRGKLLCAGADNVHQQLITSTKKMTSDIGSVENNLVPRIDQVAKEIDLWRKEMTRIADETHGNVKTLHKEIEPMQAAISNIDQYQQGHADDSFFEWLSPLTTAFENKQSDTFNLRCKQDRAGDEFLQSKEYLDWVEGSGGALWCLGGPGVGKTVLASSIIHSLQQDLHPEEGLVYIYCEHTEAKQHDPARYSISLLASVARQLGSQEGDPTRAFVKLRQRYTKSKASPTLEECSKAMVAAAAPLEKIFVIIDAFDECPNESRSDLLNNIECLEPKARILITSRCTFSRLYDATWDKEVKVRALDSDIAEYVRASTGNFKDFMTDISGDELLQEKIVTEVVTKAAGMFLLAKLCVLSLVKKPTIYALEMALTSLPVTLGQIYDEIIKRIEVGDPDQGATTRKLIKWISLAMRPLKLEELQVALAIEPGDLALNLKKVPPRSSVLRICPDIIELQRDDTLGFVHLSIQEHFANGFASEQSFIAITCLTYLSFEPFNEGPCDCPNALGSRFRANPLFQYACLNLGYHARRSDNRDVCNRALEFCEKKKALLSCVQVNITPRTWHFRMRYRPSQFSVSVNIPIQGHDTCCLWLATYYGWYDLVLKLLEGSPQVEHCCIIGSWAYGNREDYPFWTAVSENHPEIVKLFVKHGIDVNHEGPHGLTALHMAAKRGYQSFMLELLHLGADVGLTDIRGWTAFEVAHEQGNEELISHLLTYSLNASDVIADHKSGNTALHKAAVSSEVNAISVLLRQKARIGVLYNRDKILFDNKRTSDGFLGLLHRGKPNAMKLAIMRVLIEKGAEVSGRNRDGQTALHFAANQGKTDIVGRLMKLGACVNMVDRQGRTALFLAIRDGHSKTAKFLIEHGAQLDVEDSSNVLLVEATYGRQLDVIDLLLKHGADVNQCTDDGDVALIRLIKNQNLERKDFEIVQKLLAAWADPNIRDMNGLSALDYARALGKKELVEILIDFGAKDSLVNQSIWKDTTAPIDAGDEMLAIRRNKGIEIKDELREIKGLFHEKLD